MQCKTCGFLVPANLKFVLMKNFCPQCGSELFSQKEMNDISMIQNKILLQPFSKELSEEVVYDIAMFFFNELKNGFGQALVQDMIKKSAPATTTTYSEDDDSDDEDFKEKIRKEIEQEMLKNSPPTKIVEDGEEIDISDVVFSQQEDDRAEKLKQVYKKNSTMLKKPGPNGKKLTGPMVVRTSG